MARARSGGGSASRPPELSPPRPRQRCNGPVGDPEHATERTQRVPGYALWMTAPRSRFESDSAAPVTGVASGGLGTGANLEDTQVFHTEDLAASAPRTPDPIAETPEPIAAAPAPPVSPEPAPVHPAKPVASPPDASAPDASAPVSPVVPARSGRGSPNRQPGRGLAGLLAAALVVLAGVAFVVASNDGTFGAGESVPSAGAPATTSTPDGPARCANASCRR